MPASNASTDSDIENDPLDDCDIEQPPTSLIHARWSQQRQISYQSITSPVETLPPELLIHILRHLSTSPADLHSALLVSRKWSECAVELLWHKPGFSRLPALFKCLSVLGRAESAFPMEDTLTFPYPSFIRRLNFAQLAIDLSDALFIRLTPCTRLERLTLVKCQQISDDALQRVLLCLPHLVALDLTGVTDTTDAAICVLATNAARLQGINLGQCSKITDVGISALATHCPLLRRIKLSSLDQITDASVSLLARSCPLLLEIDLDLCIRVTSHSVRDMWVHSTHMRELRLSHCAEIDDAGFPVPPIPSQIQGSADNGAINPFPTSNGSTPPPEMNGTGPNGLLTVTILPPLRLTGVFEHLRMLDLTACAKVTDAAVEGFITNAPKIRNLVLAKCSNLTDKAVASICKLGKHLHYLHLGHASEITDLSIRHLAISCTRLRYIDLACCTHLTDMSVFELSGLLKLRRVGLVRVSKITDDGVIALGHRSATLERIHLSYCENITLRAVHHLLNKLGKLTHLSLTGIPAFRRPELQKWCRPAPRDFNSAQRLAFCVYSGTGIAKLKLFLDGKMSANSRHEPDWQDGGPSSLALRHPQHPHHRAPPYRQHHQHHHHPQHHHHQLNGNPQGLADALGQLIPDDTTMDEPAIPNPFANISIRRGRTRERVMNGTRAEVSSDDEPDLDLDREDDEDVEINGADEEEGTVRNGEGRPTHVNGHRAISSRDSRGHLRIYPAPNGDGPSTSASSISSTSTTNHGPQQWRTLPVPSHDEPVFNRAPTSTNAGTSSNSRSHRHRSHSPIGSTSGSGVRTGHGAHQSTDASVSLRTGRHRPSVEGTEEGSDSDTAMDDQTLVGRDSAASSSTAVSRVGLRRTLRNTLQDAGAMLFGRGAPS